MDNQSERSNFVATQIAMLQVRKRRLLAFWNIAELSEEARFEFGRKLDATLERIRKYPREVTEPELDHE